MQDRRRGGGNPFSKIYLITRRNFFRKLGLLWAVRETSPHQYQVMKTTTLMIVAASMGLIGFAQAEEVKEAKKERPERKLPPELIEKFDKDGDGKLNKQEREAARAERRARMEERRKQALEKFDTDKDGELSKEERKAMKEARRAKRLEKFDADGDGELSEEERAEMRKAMQGRHHGPHGKKGKRKERREQAQ